MYDPTKDKDYVKTITTVLNKQDNGGESVTITTHIFDNGDPKPNCYWTMSSITLNSYGRSATIDLGSMVDITTFKMHLEKLEAFEGVS